MSLRNRVFGWTLITTLACALPLFANDREAGPRGRIDKSPIQRFIQFIIHALDDVSIPPGR